MPNFAMKASCGSSRRDLQNKHLHRSQISTVQSKNVKMFAIVNWLENFFEIKIVFWRMHFYIEISMFCQKSAFSPPNESRCMGQDHARVLHSHQKSAFFCIQSMHVMCIDWKTHFGAEKNAFSRQASRLKIDPPSSSSRNLSKQTAQVRHAAFGGFSRGAEARGGSDPKGLSLV